MESNFSYAALIVLIPFLAFLGIGLTSHKLKNKTAGLIAVVAIGFSTVLAYKAAYDYFILTGKTNGIFQPIKSINIEWLRFTEQLHIDLGVLLDPISVLMLIVITTVSLMVFIYSLGYMKGEKGFNRYFAFLCLFSFSMLGLVVATNIFQMYIFWELVGVSSYLLIGFYYTKAEAVAAAKKAFIVTRFADLGFLIGILILSFHFGTFDFIFLTNPDGAVVMQEGPAVFMGLSAVSFSMILIFMGGAGKSAMFPLHIWLPDAMEGPTPVSALIHAATMVVAGVYLVARMFPIYALNATTSLEVVAFIGAFTALFAAIIACTQRDIKRVLAYSTMSQIGYMMLALGVSGYGGEEGLGYTASMFHLFTHAFFKALLFLGAGSVIHAVHSNDVFKMGGLRKYMPVTHITFLVACLAISGIPPFAGFFSKDEILTAAFTANKFYFIIGFLVAGLTAFYMFRIYFLTFWNKEPVYEKDPHESPSSMKVPMIILAAGSILAGFVPFGEFVSSDLQPLQTHLHLEVAIPSVLIGLAGLAVAFRFYKKESALPEKMTERLGAFYQWAYSKFYIDELYLFITRKIIFRYISRPIAWFDRNIVDGTMNGIAWITNTVSSLIKGFQSGQLQKYAFVFITGVIILALAFIYYMI